MSGLVLGRTIPRVGERRIGVELVRSVQKFEQVRCLSLTAVFRRRGGGGTRRDAIVLRALTLPAP